jgi:hypothetical protein
MSGNSLSYILTYYNLTHKACMSGNSLSYILTYYNLTHKACMSGNSLSYKICKCSCLNMKLLITLIYNNKQ